MLRFARSLKIARTVAAVAALWLCIGQSAKAGDGGEDLGSLQQYINAVCGAFRMSSCPQIPTISQAVLQVAAFVDIAPEAVRSSTAFAIPVGPYVDAGNPSRPPGVGCSPSPCTDPHSCGNKLSRSPGFVPAKLFAAPCINYQGEHVTAKTYAHDMTTTVHPDMPRWMRDHVSESTCRDLIVRGMKFFRADAPKLFAEMMELAKRDIIAYPQSVRK